MEGVRVVGNILKIKKIAISYLTRIVLYEKVDAPCDKLAMVVGQTSTVASIVNLFRATPVASLSH